MLRVWRYRRAAGPKPTDYDHEIGLVSHDEALPPQETGRDDMSPEEPDHGASLAHGALRPSVEVQHMWPSPTPDVLSPDSRRIVPHRPQDRRETAMDILYENERGGFLCGVALFSSRALGGLDPPAWTNAYHRSSPTSIHTAQVPDPSWVWVWPEWRVNRQEGVGEDGWEYSFAFASAFSWHGPRWWNSFVRRRAWIRKRARKRPGDDMLNADYFSIRPASHRSGGSLLSSRMPSKSSLARVSACEVDEEPPDIGDMGTLLATLRAARIDREKTEAVDDYLAHALDLPLLQGEMYEIMSLFVFQASRRQLLSHLMRKRDETLRELRDEGGGDTPGLREHSKALDAAVRHADEEVGRLAYWSDVKKMAEGGELNDGWYRGADQGLDQSGPAEPNKGKLPGP